MNTFFYKSLHTDDNLLNVQELSIVEQLTSSIIFVLFFLFFALAALRVGKNVKNSREYTVANQNLNSAQVSWVIIATLVGGVSTVGTVQSAYDHGLIAGIFTLGCSISCLILGLFFSAALRYAQVRTIAEFLGRAFGPNFQMYSSFFSSLGMFIHIVAQYLAAIAILQSTLHLPQGICLAVTTLLTGTFVLSGGITSTGLIGKMKFFILYGIMIICGTISLVKGGGIEGIVAGLPSKEEFLNVFPNGYTYTLRNLFAMITGVVSTQIYLQAIFSANTIRQARNGALLSAASIPPIGILGIIIGCYLRSHFPQLAGNSAQALPFFFTEMFPGPVAAFCSASILLVVLGTGAGLVLGVSTNICVDLLQKLKRTRDNSLMSARACGLFVLLLAAALVLLELDDTILHWSYLSMGLRGSSIFAGLCLIVFLKRKTFPPSITFLLYALPIVYIAANIW